MDHPSLFCISKQTFPFRKGLLHISVYGLTVIVCPSLTSVITP